jgi:hypothetical protein
VRSRADWFREVGLNPDGNGNYSRPETFTAAELMARELPTVRWVVPGLLPEGLTLLVGKPKVRKSFMALGLCAAIASGGVALGKVSVESGESLYLALEDNERRLQNRLGAILRDKDVPDRLHIALDWPRLDEGGVEELRHWLAGHPDASVVVVDTLAKVRSRQRGQSLYQEDYAAIEGLQTLAAEHGVAILVVHHQRKMDAADPLDTISGSTGLSGGADGVLVLRKDRGKADAFLYVTGREIEEERELALRWDPDLTGWVLVGDAEEHRLSEERAEILRVLEETGQDMTPTEVADALGKSANTIKLRLWRMSKDGQLVSQGGRYTSASSNPGNRVTQEESDLGYTVTQVTYTPGGDGTRAQVSVADGPCIHDYPSGKGCFLCDPEHAARRGPRQRGEDDEDEEMVF